MYGEISGISRTPTVTPLNFADGNEKVRPFEFFEPGTLGKVFSSLVFGAFDGDQSFVVALRLYPEDISANSLADPGGGPGNTVGNNKTPVAKSPLFLVR